MDHGPPYGVYIHPVTGEQRSTKHAYGIDLWFDGMIWLDDFNEIYGCDIQPTVDISE